MYEELGTCYKRKNNGTDIYKYTVLI